MLVGAEWTLYQSVEDVKDSMLMQSETGICDLQTPQADGAFIEVCGEVEVWFNGNPYYDCSEFPNELTELFESGKAYEDERVQVEWNNWFELFYYDRDGRINFVSDVVDIEGCTEMELYAICADWIIEFRKREEKENEYNKKDV